MVRGECHCEEHIRFAQCKLSEESIRLRGGFFASLRMTVGLRLLRCVCPERPETLRFAQSDRSEGLAMTERHGSRDSTGIDTQLLTVYSDVNSRRRRTYGGQELDGT